MRRSSWVSSSGCLDGGMRKAVTATAIFSSSKCIKCWCLVSRCQLPNKDKRPDPYQIIRCSSYELPIKINTPSAFSQQIASRRCLDVLEKQPHRSSSGENMVGLKCSRVVLALVVVSLALGELADDFNIPEGWRMEVNRLYAWISIASSTDCCLRQEATDCSLRQA